MTRLRWREALLASLPAFLVFRLLMEAVGRVAAHGGGRHIWDQWDVGWFSGIASRGYPALSHVVDRTGSHDGTAFPPAMPVLMRAGGTLGLSPATAGLLVSGACLLIAMVLLYQLVLLDHPASIARWTLVLLVAYPFAVFLGVAYAESLVLLGAVGAWLAGRRGHWWLAGLAVGVALLAKIVFIVLLLPLTLEALGWDGGRALHLEAARLRRVVALWVPALAALGAWMLYLAVTFNQPLRFLAAQRGWGRSLGLPIHDIAYVFTPGGNLGVRFINSVDGFALALLALMTIYVHRHVRPTYGVLLGAAWVIFAFNTSLQSNGRHLLLLFPVFIGLAVWTEGRRWLRPLLVGAQLPLWILLVARFATGHWAG
ncbi:MAG TPA: hypothetical protein VIN56_09275 [Candidatus Dormibacteraeota bacterium]